VRATDINDAMELAAVHALAGLAREDVPDGVLKAYGLDSLALGREYLIPKPFDYRVLLRVPPAVAKAAMESGVAQVPIDDFQKYQRRLETLISRRLELMRGIVDRARRDPKRVVFPEGEHDQILRAAKILVEEGTAHPVLLARREVIADRLRALDLSESRVTIIHAESSEKLEIYAQRLHELRRRDGITLEEARKRLRLRNWFGSMMVEQGDADGLISGLTQSYPETIRPALQIVGTRPGVRRVSGAYVLILNERIFFLADTTVNIDPTPEELAEIALLTVDFARRFGVVPRVAMLSFSNFGSNTHPSAVKMRRAAEIVNRLEPGLEVDGEMQADTAVFESILHETYPWSRLKEPANILIFPELQSANIAYKLIWRLADAEAIGPILLGMAKPVHVLQSGLEVSDIVNMTALCVVDAQELEQGGAGWKPAPVE
jgi:malate dehydrogenase (oxaloacetate-decarboxylating)(NADP+)